MQFLIIKQDFQDHKIMKKILILIAAIGLMAFTEGEKHCYVKVSKTWYDANNGYKKGVNEVNAKADTLGIYYISINAFNEFQELFDTKQSTNIYWLYPNAFPKDSINGK